MHLSTLSRLHCLSCFLFIRHSTFAFCFSSSIFFFFLLSNFNTVRVVFFFSIPLRALAPWSPIVFPVKIFVYHWCLQFPSLGPWFFSLPKLSSVIRWSSLTKRRQSPNISLPSSCCSVNKKWVIIPKSPKQEYHKPVKSSAGLFCVIHAATALTTFCAFCDWPNLNTKTANANHWQKQFHAFGANCFIHFSSKH